MKNLTIEQVELLASKGIIFENTLMSYVILYDTNVTLHDSNHVRNIMGCSGSEAKQIVAPILQEVLDKLPHTILKDGCFYCLMMTKKKDITVFYYLSMYDYSTWGIQCSNNNPLQASLDLLHWAVDNHHIKV